jgi:flagellar hook-associated protein 2
MVSSIAKSLGVGSGVDVSQLVSDLAAASRDPKIARLDKRESSVKAQISALAQARSDFETLTESLGRLVTDGALRTQISVSDEGILRATAMGDTPVGALASDLEVMQLARAQTLVSGSFASATSAIGQGPFTLSVAGQDYAIPLTAGNETLTGLADAINASGSGISASVRGENGGFRLILKGQTGLANSFTLTGASDLNLTQAQAAQNAIVKVDGVSYQRASNSMSDVIPGVTLDIKKADPGALVSLGATRPTGAITSTMTDFVAAMNDLKKTLASARSSTNARAVFELERRLSRLIGQPLTSSANGPRSMADLGVTTNRDGSLSLDSKKLEAALKSWPDAVEAMFNPLRDSTHSETTDPGISGAMSAIKTSALASNGGLDALKARLQKEADALAILRTRTEEREAANKDRLLRNFAGMDSRVTSLKATQAYLDQQIAQWNRSA